MALIGNVDANINTVDTDSSIAKVHEDMNSLVKYMIRDESNIIIDTDTSINKENGAMNYLVKYMIRGQSNIIIDTDISMN